MTSYRVAEATQVNHQGRVYGAGETFDANDNDVRPLLDSGLITEADTQPAKVEAERKPVENAESKPVRSKAKP